MQWLLWDRRSYHLDSPVGKKNWEYIILIFEIGKEAISRGVVEGTPQHKVTDCVSYFYLLCKDKGDMIWYPWGLGWSNTNHPQLQVCIWFAICNNNFESGWCQWLLQVCFAFKVEQKKSLRWRLFSFFPLRWKKLHSLAIMPCLRSSNVDYWCWEDSHEAQMKKKHQKLFSAWEVIS
jgi:hypothetical protein